MRHIFTILIALVAFSGIARSAETIIASGDVSGIWTAAQSPYVVQGDITIPSGQTLEIQRGVIVSFSGPYGLTVNGLLKTEAAKDNNPSARKRPPSKADANSICFTTDLKKNPAGWRGIRFVKARQDCRMENCIIENARGQGNGGGIYCEESKLDLMLCTIRNNSATESGAGIACINSNLGTSNIDVSDNSAGRGGAAIYISGSEVKLSNASVSRNGGGAIACVNGATLNGSNCFITRNVGAKRGAGIFAVGSTVDLTNTNIDDNNAGGLALRENSRGTLRNCTIFGNRGEEGGVFAQSSTLNLTNVTLRQNESGGVACTDNSRVEVINCTLKENIGPAMHKDDSSTVSTENCLVEG